MGKVYLPPKEIGPEPKFGDFTANGFDSKGYHKAIESFREKVKAYCRENGNGEYAGTEIHFPVADGYAEYVIFSLKPVTLIHLPIGDAWEFQYANRLTAKDIKDRIESTRALDKLLSAPK